VKNNVSKKLARFILPVIASIIFLGGCALNSYAQTEITKEPPAYKTRILEPQLLWQDQAPGAMGDSPADKPNITPYLLEGQRPFAAVVVCPGGGYAGLADHEGKPIAEWLNSIGVSAFVLQYRVAPYKHPVPLGDAQRAIRLIRSQAKEWNIDPQRIGILGFSAGGHLVTSTATIFDTGYPEAKDPIDRQSCKPNALVACYPVISFGEYRHHGSMVNLIGENPDIELRTYMSLENRVTEDTCPSFLWHTAEDQAVPVENSLLFALALSKNKVPFELHIFPHGVHGLGLAQNHPEANAWPNLCATWLKELGFRSNDVK
jgi:acetyl esterase/lipase